jgi:hypothetical protein
MLLSVEQERIKANQAVLVTAARLRMLLNVKSLGLGGGPRRRALGRWNNGIGGTALWQHKK